MNTDFGERSQNELRRLARYDAAGFVAAVIRNNGVLVKAQMDFRANSPDAQRRLELFARAAVAPGTTSDAAFAKPLANGASVTDLVVEGARARSVLNELPIVSVPMGTPVAVETNSPAAAFVGEGLPTPVTQSGYRPATVPPAKIAIIIPLSAELVKLSSPAAARSINESLSGAIAVGADTVLLGTSTPVANVTPGGIFSGVTPITPSGTTAAAAAKDAATAVATHLALVPDASRSVFVVPPATAAILRSQYPHEPLTVTGGSFLGLPAVVSASVGAKIAVVDAGRLLVADDGLELDVSSFATVQMNTAPDSPLTAATIVTSFWQCDIVGVKAIRFLSWAWGTATPQATLVAPTAYVAGT